MKHSLKKKYVYVLLSVIVVIAGLLYLNPIAFAKDGLLTKMKVDAYEAQFDLGSTRRHNAEEKNIYLFYLGFDNVEVQSEEASEGREMEIQKVGPFLYRWKWRLNDGIYRVSIGEDKYYFTLVVT